MLLKSLFKTTCKAKDFNPGGTIEDCVDLVKAEFLLIKEI
jgi:hypothetical protein